MPKGRRWKIGEKSESTPSIYELRVPKGENRNDGGEAIL